MANDLSAENERFIEQQVAAGVFPTRTEAIDAAIELFRQRKDLLDRLDEGRRQLDHGEYSEYDGASLAKRFDELRTRPNSMTPGQTTQ